MMKKRHLNFQLFPFKIAAVDDNQQAILKADGIKQDRRSGYILPIVLFLLFCFSINTLKAQACTGTANIPPNGTFSVNGVTVTSASTGFVSTFAATYSSCGVDTFSPNSLLVGSSSGGSAPWQTGLTFSQPVNDIVVIISATEAGENFRFVSNGGTISITTLNSCSTSVSGNTITGTGTLPPYGGGGRFRITAPTAFTTLTMNGGGGTSGALLAICQTSIVACSEGSAAPPLTATTLTTTCPSLTANLNSLHTATPPTGTQLVWYTNSSHTGAAYATPTAATAGTYYAFYTSSASCFSQASTAVTVSNPPGPAFTTNLATGTNSECQNKTATTLTVAATGVSYQWYSNTTNSTTGGTLIGGATSASYTPPTTATGTRYYYVIITDNSTACSTTSNIRTVTVNANPTFSTTPATSSETRCQNAAATAINATTAGMTYQWYSNTANNNTTGTAISGATAATYTPPTTTPGTTYYYVVITNAAGCSTASNIRTEIVNPLPVITTQPDDTAQNICVGGTATPLTVTATNAVSYQWWYSTALTGGTLSTATGTGATTASYTPLTTAAAVGTRYYYVVVTNACGTATSTPRTPVTVTALPTYSTNQTAGTQTVCQNGTANTLSVTGATGTTGYQWYSNTTNSNTGGTLISGATANTYTPSTATVGTTYYYAVISNAAGCTAASNVRGVTVNQLITVQPNSTPQNICVGGTATTLSVTAPGATSYAWYYSDAPTGGPSYSMFISTTITSYTPPTTTAHATRYYYVVVTGPCGTVESSPRTPVTVYNIPTAVSVTPATQSVPYNGTPTNLTATTTNATSYQWYSNTTNSSTGGTAISGATSATYTPPTNAAGTFYYYVTALNGGTCSTTSSAVQVIVSSCSAGSTAPTVNTAVSNLCPATTANLNTQAHTGAIPVNATLVWYTDATHTTAVPTPTAVGAGTYYAFYYSSTGNCYSPASAPITVTTNACAPCTAADPMPANLSNIDVPAAPTGAVTQWHNSATPSASTLLSSTTVMATSTPTNYWVYYYDTTNHCYSPGSKATVVSNSCCNYPTVNLSQLSHSAVPNGSTLVWYANSTHDFGTQVSDPLAVGNGTYWPFFYDAVSNCYSPAGTPVIVAVDNVCSTACYKPGITTGTALDTKVGISALGRAGEDDADKWPMTRKGGWIALEAKTKGFVPNRVAFSDADNNASTPDVPVGIDPANFVEGMMVYDTTHGCMKVYTLKDGDMTMAWHCVTTQTCPD